MIPERDSFVQSAAIDQSPAKPPPHRTETSRTSEARGVSIMRLAPECLDGSRAEKFGRQTGSARPGTVLSQQENVA